MPPSRFSRIGHAEHDLMNPVAPGRLERVLAPLALGGGERVADLGCGKGELLVRLLERGAHEGWGVDADAELLAEARSRARRRVPGARLDLVHGDAAAWAAARAPGSLELLACVGASHALGGTAAAAATAVRLLAPGGHLLLGEGYWRRPPEPAYLEAIGGTADELLDRASTLALLAAKGFDVVRSEEASAEDWDAYEGLYARSLERWARENPDDPEREAYRRRIRRWQEAYRRWGRSTLGFALDLLRRRDTP